MLYEKLPETELLIMKILWKTGRAMEAPEIRKLMEQEYDRQWAAQTMSTYLRMLVQKGFLKVTRAPKNVFLYEPLVDEDSYQQADMYNNIHEMTDLWGQRGFIKNMVAALHGAQLSKEDISELRSLIHDGDNN